VSIRLKAAIVVLALAAAACSNADDDTAGGSDPPDDDGGSAGPITGVPGVTDDEVRFSVFGTRSNNPLGTCVLDCYVDGIEAYFAFRNADGGVHGRDLVLAAELDDELSNNQQRALEIVSADDTFAAFSATQIASGWQELAKAGIPLYGWGIHFNEMNGQESIWANVAVICGVCTRRFTSYAGTVVEATKVAALGYGVSEASKDCANSGEATAELYGGETGQEFVYKNDDMAFGLPNGVAPEVSEMKRAGVDFIVGCLDLNGMKTLAQEMERQGMGDVPMLHANTYDQAFVAEAGDLFEGDLVQVGFRPFEADPGDSGLADYIEWMEATGSEPTELALVGWINADLAYQGLVEAGPEFDRAKVIEATNGMTAYTAGGLIPPVDWSRQHVPPTEEDPTTHGYAEECQALVQIADGAFEVVGDEAKPFHCWDGADRAWAEPTPMNFE
jgi:ABC-type branched-subunit amino acid transport system substrate-binding protein